MTLIDNTLPKGIDRYPHVMTEDETLDAALSGRSIARYGDGELRIVYGGTASAQRRHGPELGVALRHILERPQKALICIPHFRTPKLANWRPYVVPKYTRLYQQAVYGSAFITRPDSAPWINRKDYWDKMRALWSNRDITLVIGSDRSLTADRIAKDCKSLRVVRTVPDNAWNHVDAIETDIGTPDGSVILCLGPTATVLAVRLVNKGIHALDLGHVGMFMRRLGVMT